MLQKFRKTEKGFTLIELLVVIAIIGILAAVAIPQFANYRRNAYCSRVESDVNNTMLAMEAYYAANDVYSIVLTELEVAASKDVTLVPTAPAAGSGLPVIVAGSDDTLNCPKGTTYTITQGLQPAWS
jgi:type IV pilus assembly protein PilA